MNISPFQELAEKLDNMEKRISALEAISPQQFHPDPSFLDRTMCSKCGLHLEGVLLYTCPNYDCPAGLGPVISSVIG